MIRLCPNYFLKEECFSNRNFVTSLLNQLYDFQFFMSQGRFNNQFC